MIPWELDFLVWAAVGNELEEEISSQGLCPKGKEVELEEEDESDFDEEFED